ncbi:invasion associated locus B family protein [Citreicella sp. C3M06]|nr:MULTISPECIES: invasion associated locus B family protein [Roseobacteraceae]MBU2960612.1 invasion associated locus B family protein [Citreicella sp. C3M06]MDO6585985.1 invasion associated locus B family protein [Salipiger sp. 1_MG-2023]
MIGALTGAVALAFAGVATAQEESQNRVNAITDWSVFEGDNPRECWAVTTYKESVNSKDGRVVSVRRGDILLMVFYRPGANVAGQVAFTGGYPFAPGSTVNANVSGNQFELYVDGEWAWPASPADDAKLIAAMRSGSDAVLTAHSARGTQTKDTFSLMGFTAAIEDAEKRCK